MGFSKRVGALALAIGVGVGLATSPAIAVADDTESSVQPNPPAPPADPPVDVTPASVEPDEPDPPEPDPGPTPDPRDGIVHAGGGAIVRTDNEPEPEPQPETPLESQPPAAPTTSLAPPPPPVIEVVQPEATTPPNPPGPATDLGGANRTATAEDAADDGLTVIVMPADPGPAPTLGSAVFLEVPTINLRTAPPPVFAAPPTSDTSPTTLAAPVPVPSLRQILLAPITALMNGLLGALGLGPVALPPGPPLTPFPLFEIVFAVFRRLESTVQNHTPSATVTTGDVDPDGVDPDGDALTNPTDHSATVAVLTFTFTDGYGGVTTQSVAVPIGKLNDGPEVACTIGAVDAATRVVSGTLTVIDADGEPIAYAAHGAAHGDIAFVDGTWTYTPTAAALHEAARTTATAAQTTDTFTLSIDDGHGGAVDVPVSVSLLSPITAQTAAVQRLSAGGGPYYVTVGVDGRYVYVSDVHAATLGVLDTTTGTITYLDTAAPVGRSVLAAGGRLVAENGSNSTVTVVDTTTNTVVATIPVGGYAEDLVATLHGARTYLFVHTPNDEYDLAVIDTATNAVVGKTHLGESADLPVLGQDGTKLYFRDYSGSGVKVVDTATLAVTDFARGDALDYLDALALSPDGNQLYVSTTSGLYVFDTQSGAVLELISERGGPFIVLSPDGSTVYTTRSDGSALSIIDSATFDVTDVAAGPGPINAIVTPDGRQVFTLNRDGTISVVDTVALTSEVIDVHGADDDLYQVAISPDGRHLYVPQLATDTLAIVSAGTANVAPTLTVDQISDPGSGGVIYTVTGADGDADELTYAATPLVAGTLTALSGGSFLFVPDPTQLGHLPAGVNDVLAITISDGHGGFTTARGTYDVAPSTEISVVATVDFGGDVRSVVVTPDGSTAYLAVVDHSANPRIEVVDTATGTVLAILPYATAQQYGLSLNADGSRLLVNGARTVRVLDTTHAYREVFATDLNAEYAVLDADGTTFVAGGHRNAWVYDVDPDGETFGAVLATIPTGGYPTGMTRGADGLVYFSTGDFVVTAVDPTCGAVVARVLTTSGAYNVTAAPGRVYATLYGTSLAVIDTASNTVIANPPLKVGSGGPYATANADGSRLYLSRFTEGLFSVYDPAADTIVATVRVGDPHPGDGTQAAGYVNAAAVSTDGSLVVVPVGRSIVIVSTGRTIES
ncbi:MAG: VCBS domain-containing protein [Mycobacterium sp.]